MKDVLRILTNDMIPAVEKEMREILQLRSESDPLYGMMQYHLGWADENFVANPSPAGKRVRPLLCLLVTKAAGGEWLNAVPGSACLEFLHNFSLVHDDIQDASPTRRGRPTLWQIWGVNLAINAGDAMFAVAHLALSRMLERGVAASTIVIAFRRLDETCIALTDGQHADMTFELRDDVTVAEYLEMIGGKTAALLSYSTELGARVASCSSDATGHYHAFGRDLGLAFQIRDDILGIWGDESIIGKSAASDIITRKKSLPVLYGLSQREELRDLYGHSDGGSGFVDRVVQILNEIDARGFAEEYEEKYANRALEHLSAAGSEGEAADGLLQLTQKLLNRQA